MPQPCSVAIRDLSFCHDSATAPLFEGLNVIFPPGFTGVVGANGAGKTTLLQLVCGQLWPETGHIENSEHAVYCAQRTDSPPRMLADFLQDYDAHACILRGQLGIEHDYLERWSLLSHGQRKRTQIAHALWQRPQILAIDEPTNHIDAQAREVLLEALRGFIGVGLIVSHDRAWIDALCGQCLWLEHGRAEVRPGGYTTGLELRLQAQASACRERDKLVDQGNRLQRELAARRETASRANKKRSKRGLSSKDHDAKSRINLARLTGKDGQAGRLLGQLSARAERSAEQAKKVQVDKVRTIDFWLPESRSKRRLLLDVPPGRVELGDGRALVHPQLVIRPSERIALSGANGLGKSSLLRHLAPLFNVEPDCLTQMPQDIDIDNSLKLIEHVRGLPAEQLGHVMNVVAGLGSEPSRLLRSALPSPGEIRKLMLAVGISNKPHLIVLDEPTNHLDLPSIEAMQNALADCPCALLLVSHDQTFLSSLATSQWEIRTDSGNLELTATRLQSDVPNP